MSDANFVIVGVMGGGNLNGTSTERHVDNDVVGNDGDFAVGDEGVLDEFAVKVLE